MGTDAHIDCDCLRRGKTKPLPFDPAYLVREEAFWYIREDMGLSNEQLREYDSQLRNWLQTCCPHPEMHYYDNRVGNVYGMGQLAAVIDAAGGTSQFPIISMFYNSSCIPYTEVAKANGEIARLKAQITQMSGYYIV